MSSDINYKQKYQELKSKFMSSVDMAFRLGFEEGAKQAQQDTMMQQAQQQMQQAQDMQNKAALAQNGGMPGQEEQAGPEGAPDAPAAQPGMPGQDQPNVDNAASAGSELDEHISKLESMVNKSEISSDDLKKYLVELKDLQKSLKMESDLKKSAAAIPEIAKALHKPQFKIGVQASKNMTSTAKQAVSMQQKIVDDIMNKWKAEESKASSNILSQLGIEGLTKKE